MPIYLSDDQSFSLNIITLTNLHDLISQLTVTTHAWFALYCGTAAKILIWLQIYTRKPVFHKPVRPFNSRNTYYLVVFL